MIIIHICGRVGAPEEIPAVPTTTSGLQSSETCIGSLQKIQKYSYSIVNMKQKCGEVAHVKCGKKLHVSKMWGKVAHKSNVE